MDLGAEAAQLVLGGRRIALAGEGGLPLVLGSGAPVAQAVLADAELARLRAENARLRAERDLLKKAAAYFASPPS